MNRDLESYLDGALDPEAKRAFEAQLAQDPELREAVSAAQRLRDDLAWLAVERGVAVGEKAYMKKKMARTRQRRWFGWLVSGMILLGLGILLWKWSGRPVKEAPIPQVIQDSIPSIHPQRVPEVVKDTFKQEHKVSDVRQLFAAYFKPYKDETLEPSLRGDAEPSSSEKFQQFYWEGKYREALIQFETLPVSAKANDNLLFLQAECLMALGKVEEAIPVYGGILQRDRARYMEAAAWHRALAYLKLGKMEETKAQLQGIGRSSSRWRAEALALLKRI